MNTESIKEALRAVAESAVGMPGCTGGDIVFMNNQKVEDGGRDVVYFMKSIVGATLTVGEIEESGRQSYSVVRADGTPLYNGEKIMFATALVLAIAMDMENGGHRNAGHAKLASQILCSVSADSAKVIRRHAQKKIDEEFERQSAPAGAIG